MKRYHVKHLDKLKNKIPAKLVTMILRCIHPDQNKRCDMKQILEPELGSDNDMNWFSEMKNITFLQLTPKIIKEENDYLKFIHKF